MSYKLVLDFDDPGVRELVLSWLCDGGGEELMTQVIDESTHGELAFDYSQALEGWGWDGQGAPTVAIAYTAGIDLADASDPDLE